MEKITVNNKEYTIIKLLGRGKGGYSYLTEHNGSYVVVKQIHHEPCSYYSFGNKIEAEKNDYIRLVSAGIRVPEMIDIDLQKERIVKEYIAGDTIYDMIANNADVSGYYSQIQAMAALAKAAGMNMDYFPTNFIPQNGLLYYVDYECNDYSDEWNYENWGKKYWARTPEFENHLQKTKEGC